MTACISVLGYLLPAACFINETISRPGPYIPPNLNMQELTSCPDSNISRSLLTIYLQIALHLSRLVHHLTSKSPYIPAELIYRLQWGATFLRLRNALARLLIPFPNRDSYPSPLRVGAAETECVDAQEKEGKYSSEMSSKNASSTMSNSDQSLR